MTMLLVRQPLRAAPPGRELNPGIYLASSATPVASSQRSGPGMALVVMLIGLSANTSLDCSQYLI